VNSRALLHPDARYRPIAGSQTWHNDRIGAMPPSVQEPQRFEGAAAARSAWVPELSAKNALLGVGTACLAGMVHFWRRKQVRQGSLGALFMQFHSLPRSGHAATAEAPD
jgi:hypothetical protein